jgi:hypothetical protein
MTGNPPEKVESVMSHKIKTLDWNKQGRSEQAEMAHLDPLSDGKKRRISCQSPYLAKFPEMKSISKPQLLVDLPPS